MGAPAPVGAIKSLEKRKKEDILSDVLCGGDYRTRICDLLRVKQALYRLS